MERSAWPSVRADHPVADAGVVLEAVVEVNRPTAVEPVPWPTASTDPYSWLRLHGSCSDDEVGLFVAILASRIDVQGATSPGDVVGALLAEDFLVTTGGLRVRDAGTGMAVVPGCCAGLEDWRDWTQVLTGGSPWLGHDPGPEVKIVGEHLRVWQNGGPDRGRGRWAGVHVSLPRPALPGLLLAVRDDLVAFLGALGIWAERVVPGRQGEALVEAIDRNFTITAPLDLPQAPCGP